MDVPLLLPPLRFGDTKIIHFNFLLALVDVQIVLLFLQAAAWVLVGLKGFLCLLLVLVLVMSRLCHRQVVLQEVMQLAMEMPQILVRFEFFVNVSVPVFVEVLAFVWAQLYIV